MLFSVHVTTSRTIAENLEIQNIVLPDLLKMLDIRVFQQYQPKLSNAALHFNRLHDGNFSSRPPDHLVLDVYTNLEPRLPNGMMPDVVQTEYQSCGKHVERAKDSHHLDV